MSDDKQEKNSFPNNFKDILLSRHFILSAIRTYFNAAGYIEVETPIRVVCPGLEPYIDAIPAGNGFYLSTSPELQMKRLMTVGIPRIYQITHAFRAEESGPFHNPEFTLLEWYRINTDYLGIREETEQLGKNIVEALNDNKEINYNINLAVPFKCCSVDNVYLQCAGWQPSENWDEDKYFNDWIEKVEPYLSSLKGVFVFDFPAPLASLATLKKTNKKVCERFELFINGLEIANAFTELIDSVEQEKRFINALLKREKMGKARYPIDANFLNALRSGIPECAGVALGIDRLIMALLGYTDINMVQTFPISRL
jgi:lysyl-tRNA synthetase class 2